MIEKLLKDLIEIPSVSKQEQKIAEFVFNYLRDSGLKPKLFDRNVYCYIGKGKKSLLLNSHIDTVPPTDSWAIDPFKAKVMKRKIYGLGACDAKASVAAMICTIINLCDSDIDGRVIFAATCEEEDGNKGLERLIKKFDYDAVIIGEPTNLDICTAQKGIVRIKATAQGKSAHASLPDEGINAIHKAADDIKTLNNLKFEKQHKLLGLPSIQTTIITGGIKKNVIPDYCEFILDVRSTPIYANDYLISLIKRSINSEVEIVSNRIFPKETDIDEKIVQAARKANPNARVTGFLATSDFAFVDRPGIILGPGNLKQAHAPNEFVEISQLKKASEIYQTIAKEFFNL